MIVRYEGEQTLMDCEALCVELRDSAGRLRSPSTVRKHCAPVATDPATGRQLYDADAARKALEAVRGRTPTRRMRRS